MMRVRQDLSRAVVVAWLVATLVAPARLAQANPQGGVVHGGVAAITGQGTGVVDVTQSSQTAVLSWDSFDIQPGEVTNFIQPGADAVAINRILDGQASQILGSLNANGHVYLINPHGMLFGANATVNVHSLTAAASANAGDLIALSGGFDPSATAAPGARIENQGTIQAGTGGFVYLVAPEVENGASGVIVSPEGEIRLAAGATVYLTDRPDGLGLAVEYTAPATGSAINLGQLVADGGLVRMRGELVRQGGLVEANAVREKGGRIELYAEDSLRLESGGELRLTTGDPSTGAAAGVATLGSGGSASIAGSQTIAGRGVVKLSANESISLEDGARVGLDAQGGDATLALHAGQDVLFGTGAQIVESAASPATGGFDVQLVAGATDLSVEGLGRGTSASPTAGGVYLSGATGAPGARTPAGGDGEVSLQRGDLTVRSAGDVWIGNGGGLVNRRGQIDVEVGRDVRFTAASKTRDGVIENGSGDIRVVAGRDVSLYGGTGVEGNAAIRTRGLVDASNPDRVTRTNGGSILVHARTGDVDAGVGNRWLTPGPASSANPAADPLPVVKNGILGIGNEAGGNLTVIAGRDVRTDSSVRERTGGSAFTSGSSSGDYSGGHIGIFGQGVVDVRNGSTTTTELLPNQPESRLLVVAGGDVRGDYVIRNGRAVFRAGYALRDVDPASLDATTAAELRVDPRRVDAQIARSALAASDPGRGWFGPLASPVTVDILNGRPIVDQTDPSRVVVVRPTVDALGANGVAVRAIESPSLVYPAGGQLRTRRVASYSPFDSAWLEAEVGDVVLVGNDVLLPISEPSTPQSPLSFAENPLVRLLPPILRITTNAWCPGCPRQRGLESRGGDLVLLNDFMLFPSAHGGLTLDLAGKARTANFAAIAPTILELDARTLGKTGDQSFTLASGTRLIDSKTGLAFTLQTSVLFAPRRPALSAQGLVEFRAGPGHANDTITIPAGTRLVDGRGVVYQTVAGGVIPPPSERLSEGRVTFTTGGGTGGPVGIPAGTRLVSSDGTVFQTRQQVVIEPWMREVTADVVALPEHAGHDAKAFDLRLETPIAGIGSVLNRTATARPASIDLSVAALDPGLAGNRYQGKLRLETPIAGLEPTFSVGDFTGGDEIAAFGAPLADARATAVAIRSGPIGRLSAGNVLRIADPSQLPVGVRANDIELTAQVTGDDFTLRPVVFQALQVVRDANGNVVSTAVDPSSSRLASGTDGVWTRDAVTKTATIRQSDASPLFDARGVPRYSATQLANYYLECRSGATCGVTDPFGRPILLGEGATHAGDRSPARLDADGGFERIRFELAEAAWLETSGGSVRDLALLTQHTSALDSSRIVVPRGDARFGSGTLEIEDVDPQTGAITRVAVADQAASGLQVAGPGSAQVLVGVESHATADANGDGFIELSEFKGSAALFRLLDRDETLPGVTDGRLSVHEAPWLPTGQGGSLALQARGAEGGVLGIQTVGGLQNAVLPTGGAKLEVVAAQDIRLNERGFIGTLQGGKLDLRSVGGSITAGIPVPGTTTKRGIVTTFTGPGSAQREADATGGGDISIVSLGDFDIGGLALAALSGSAISIESIDGSVSAGVGESFSRPLIAFDNETREITVSYRGAGIAAPGGKVELVAKKDVNIGAGITGAGITVQAGGNVNAGSGAIVSSGSVSISAGQNISGTIQAGGSVSISGNVQSGSSISSSGGIVSGAGSVASNTGTGRTSADAAGATRRAEAQGGFGSGSGPATAGQRRVVLIDVTSRPCADDECES
ncbi:MAG: filamentous hemagglutinin N-terminal domain-containing protein [Myxococcota bacterium]